MGILGKIKKGKAAAAPLFDVEASPVTPPPAPTSGASPEPENVAEPTRPAPEPPVFVDGRCADLCGNRPERWVERDRGTYRDRVRVECRRCGRFIGYRLKKGEK